MGAYRKSRGVRAGALIRPGMRWDETQVVCFNGQQRRDLSGRADKRNVYSRREEKMQCT